MIDSAIAVTERPSAVSPTPRGAEILAELRRRDAARLPAPTVRELIEVLALSPSSTATVVQHLHQLRVSKLVTWQDTETGQMSPRTLRLTDAGLAAAA